MTTQDYGARILQILYEERALGPLQALDSEDLAQRMDMPWDRIRSEVAQLEQEQYLVLRRRGVGRRIYQKLHLTSSGVGFLRGRVTVRALYGQVSVDILYTHLPSGVLGLYDANTMPLVRYRIVNSTANPVKFVLTSEIDHFSFPRSDTVDVAPKTEKTVFQLPRLKVDKARTLTDIRRAVVHTWVKYLEDGSEHLLQQQDFDIYLMARSVIRWAVPDVVKGTGYKPLLEHIAAWVTPRVEPVKQMLRQAVEYHPKRAMWGYQGTPDPRTARTQVKAIYQALKLVAELAYINSPFAIGPQTGEVIQTVRLPRESLSERSANCIDGAVLYASLAEQAALEPVIVLRTGHAFVGWKTLEGAEDYEFIETTMTLREPFEKALERGMEQYRELKRHKWFDRDVFDPEGFARLLDIRALHDAGIYPME